MTTNQEKLDYTAGPMLKVHLWNSASTDERYAQNEFLNRLATTVAAKILDWEVSLGGTAKSSLRTIIRWQAADFADVKARLDALSK